MDTEGSSRDLFYGTFSMFLENAMKSSRDINSVLETVSASIIKVDDSTPFLQSRQPEGSS